MPTTTSPPASRAEGASTPLGPRLVEFGSALTSAHHGLVTLAARFEAGNEWVLSGRPTAAHWIAEHLDVCVATAREWIRIGAALDQLPAIEEAFSQADISFSKVPALTRLATAENETVLLALAVSIPAGQLGRALAAWSMKNEKESQRDQRHRQERRLSWQVEPDGQVSGGFRLPPLGAAALIAAVDALVLGTRPDRSRGVTSHATQSAQDAAAGASNGFPSLAQQRADALVALASAGGASVEPEIILHVRGDGCTLDDGTPVTDSIVDRLAPTAFLRALIHDAEGRPINASSRRRHPSVRQKRVVKARDRVCIDCGATDLLEYDHVPEHEITGHTVIDELELRCAPCHHRRHGRC